MKIVLILIAGYLLGSIPFAFVVTRWKSGKDIRDLGSKNPGATNVARTMGKVAGLIVLILDAIKGLAAVLLALSWTGSETWGAAAGFTAMLGHSFPVFLNFRGGKSVATGGGAFMILAPIVMLTSILIFIVTVSIVRVVAIGSVIAAAFFPLFAWIYDGTPGLVAWSSLSASLIILRHKQDLIQGLKELRRKPEARDA
jgi:acyl phosphate:glycerol-3-phosphate acyltransferase